MNWIVFCFLIQQKNESKCFMLWHRDSHLAQWQSPQTFLWRCRFNSCSGIISLLFVFLNFVFFYFFVCFVVSICRFRVSFFLFFIFCLLLCGIGLCTCCLLKKLFSKNSLDFFLFPLSIWELKITLFFMVTIYQGSEI